MRPGAPVELAGFSHVRSLHVGPSPEGLVRVQPDLPLLALSREHGADLRVVDGEGRQWPYLWGDEWLDRTVEATVTAGTAPAEHTSVFRIQLPAGRVDVDHLLLDIPETLVNRPYQVWGSNHPDDELRSMARGTLARLPGARGERLRVDVGHEAAVLELRVQDGDEQPLTVRGATVVTKARDLFMAAPAGEYRLLVGNERIEAPTYDVESARDLLLSLSAVDATLGPLGDNPSYAPPSPSRDALTETALLVVLGLAVLLLGVLTFRLVRDEPEAEPAGEASTESGAATSTEPGAATSTEPGAATSTEASTAASNGGEAAPSTEPSAAAPTEGDSQAVGASPAEHDKVPDDR
jgi:hypothetical protein